MSLKTETTAQKTAAFERAMRELETLVALQRLTAALEGAAVLEAA
nr:hypothetical protein [Brevundimonas naejangsanensis]